MIPSLIEILALVLLIPAAIAACQKSYAWVKRAYRNSNLLGRIPLLNPHNPDKCHKFRSRAGCAKCAIKQWGIFEQEEIAKSNA